MAAQSPITFVGTFPNITGLTQLKTGDTLSGVVNHADFSPNSLVFADAAGTVANVVVPDNTLLGNLGTGITSVTVAALAPLIAGELSVDDLFTATGLVSGDALVYANGSWTNLPNSLGNLMDVSSAAPTAGSFLVFTGTEWEAQPGPSVDGQIYGYQNGAWARIPASGGSGSSANHSDLANLLQDTHTQYHTDERADLRYHRKEESAVFLASKAAVNHQHVLADITDSGDLAALNTVSEAEIADTSVTLAKVNPAGSTAGQVVRSSGSGTSPTWDYVEEGMAITVTANSTGVKNYFVSTTSWRITGWYLVSVAPGTTMQVDVLKAANAVPNSSQSITGTELPTLTNDQLSSDLTLTTWTDLDVAVGDVIGVEVTSTDAVSELATLSLVGYRL